MHGDTVADDEFSSIRNQRVYLLVYALIGGGTWRLDKARALPRLGTNRLSLTRVKT